MQGKEITDPEAIKFYTNFITSLGKNIVDAIELFNETCDIKGIPRLHKQILNRYIENFASTDTIISGTDWKNFFNLRISDKAEPHIKELAEAMQKAMAESTPKVVTIGDYHLPYITEDEIETIACMNKGETAILVTGDANRNKIQTMPGGGFVTNEIKLPENGMNW